MDRRRSLFLLTWLLLPALRILAQGIIVNWEWTLFVPHPWLAQLLTTLAIGGIALMLCWLYQGPSLNRLWIYVAMVTMLDGITFIWSTRKPTEEEVSEWTHILMKLVPTALSATLLTALVVWGVDHLTQRKSASDLL